MNHLNKLLIVSLWMMCGSAYGDEAARGEAEQLLESMNMELVLQQAIDVSLDAQVKQKPEIAIYKGVMRQFLAKHMSYKAVKSEIIDMYANEFSKAELTEIRQFYETKTGKKALEKMPVLMAQGSAMGARRVQENISELQAMIVAESERIQQLQKQGK